MPALTPGPVGLGSSVVSLATTITPAAPPSKQGFFASARPAARPLEPQIAVKSIGPNKRLTLQEGQVTTFAVIGSFKNIENARRLVKSRLAGAIMQPVEIGGKTSYRVLVNQPLEQARKDGFADAWPVRLCSGDLQVPPCSQLVVIRDLRGVEVAARQLRR